MKRISIILFCLLVFGAKVWAQNVNAGKYTWDPVPISIVQDKNFPFFTAVEHDKKVVSALSEDEVLKSIFQEKQKKIETNLKGTDTDVTALVNAYRFTEGEIKQVSGRLERAVAREAAVKQMIGQKLRPNGAYRNFEGYGDGQMMAKAWELSARGMNHILGVYGLGKATQYAAIDSVSYDVSSKYYKASVMMWGDMLAHKDTVETKLFFRPTLDFCLSLLYFNHRDEAARYEPLRQKENKAVLDHLGDIDFDDFEYAAILILGNGPENYRDRLSALGKLNIRLGVLNYKMGKAPLIIVSGGHAHPFRTLFCEAIEMKRELMDFYHIPEERIIVEPHARHTTTNFRNAVRLMLDYKIPINKKSLVVTNNLHSAYITDKNFYERCQKELGYLPIKKLKRIDPTTLEFMGDIKSLEVNPMDPLDP